MKANCVLWLVENEKDTAQVPFLCCHKIFMDKWDGFCGRMPKAILTLR